ncbi:porin [Pusillimonas noertemannii]|uniref:porin n=1 Tax=Pusillimonas noertemannii TaxID=305977 RepID=UPI0002ED933A|nr:porin [Pusillimonas noertemannii]
MHTQHRYLAGAALGALCFATWTPSQAQSHVTLKGLADAYVGSVQYSGQSGRSNSVGNGGLADSWFGLSGVEKINGNLSATFDLESFFQINTGQGSRTRPGDTFFSRQATVGLKGDWGEIKLGRNRAPHFYPIIFFNPFLGSSIFSPLFLHSYKPTIGDNGRWLNSFNGDTGWSNSISYKTPRFSGLTANVVYQFGASGEHSRNNIGGNVMYNNGPFAATLAGHKVKLDNPNGLPFVGAAKEQTGWLAGLSYDFKWLKLYGTYQQSHHDIPLRNNTWQLGLSAPMGGGKFLLSWAHTKRDTDIDTLRRDTATAGYDYFLSKRTDAYALAMYDKVTDLNSGTSFVVGLRHQF